MKLFNYVSLLSEPKSRSCLCSLVVAMSLICGAYFTTNIWLGKDSFLLSPELGTNTLQIHTESVKCHQQASSVLLDVAKANAPVENCNDKCKPRGSEPLPKGIVSTASNLEMTSLWGRISDDKNFRNKSLLAVAVGIKQKKLVNKIVEKFLADDFAVMLLHYDGVVDKWHDYEWYNRVVHVSAANQTKWWFAKRFLHPDIVAEYDYIFLWDEDLGVENFHPRRYLSIVKEEGLEISQPALDSSQSEVHHLITVRNRRSKLHRKYFWFKGNGPKCDGNSTTPPCVGWVEMMAPVFSRAAWRCVWYMIQNDLVHAWGLDKKLGYCAQGDRSMNVGVVDEEYIVHLGLPILGDDSSQKMVKLGSINSPIRSAIRQRSSDEMKVFRQRWDDAVEKDRCWIDPYQH